MQWSCIFPKVYLQGYKTVNNQGMSASLINQQFSIPVAIIIRVAGNDTFLYVRHGKGVHKVALTLILRVTVSRRTTELKEMKGTRVLKLK